MIISKRRRIPTGYRKYSAKTKLSVPIMLFILILSIFTFYFGFDSGSSSSKTQAIVTKVMDGDTIEVKSGNSKPIKIRLLGIDTPETHHPTKPVGCYGPEASNFTTNALIGKKVELEYDIEQYDKYGRTLAFVYLDGKRFNDILVKEGYAKTLTIAPNKKYSFTLLKLEIEAEKNMVGMWGSC